MKHKLICAALVLLVVVVLVPTQLNAQDVNISISGSGDESATSTIESALSAWEVVREVFDVAIRVVTVVVQLVVRIFQIVSDVFERFIGIPLLEFLKGIWRLLIWLIGLITGGLESILQFLQGVSVE